MNSVLRFFKIVSTSEKMVIPGAVIWQMPRVNRVMLRDGYRNIWRVEVDINGDGEWSFKEGWPHFYKDNCLKPLDFMVFECNDCSTTNCVFDFKVLGENACQKKGVPNFKIKEEYEIEEDLNKDNDDEEEEDDDDESDQVCRSNKSNIFRYGVANQLINNRPCFISRSRSRENELLIPKKVMVRHKLKLPERLFLVDVRGNKWEAVIKQRKDGRVCCSGGWRSLCDTNNINKDDRCICEFILQGCQDPCILVRVVDAAGTSRNNRSYQKKHVSDCYGGDIFRQGQATRPTNIPFFVSRSRPRRYELMIPKEVRKDYKLKLPDVLFLVDERGNKWETKVKKWKDGRVMCSGGWRSLCNVNNINKDDTCICEFFLETDDPYILVRPLDATI